MKKMLLLVTLTISCMHNTAVDTVLFVLPTAKCSAALTTSSSHSARCDLPDGRKVYCVANESGWDCKELSPSPPVPHGGPPPTPPAPTSTKDNEPAPIRQTS